MIQTENSNNYNIYFKTLLRGSVTNCNMIIRAFFPFVVLLLNVQFKFYSSAQLDAEQWAN